jgi:hypothetical protein
MASGLLAPIVETVKLLLKPPPDGEQGSTPSTIGAAFLTCAVTFMFLQMTGIALPRRRRLKFGDQLEWNLRVISTIHAIVLVVGTGFVPKLRHGTRASIPGGTL